MTQELRWKSNNQRVAARAFTIMRITDQAGGGQKIEVVPDPKTGAFVEVYLATSPSPSQPPVPGVAVLHAEQP